MAVIKPCPKCQHPLEIAQPPPEQIRCPKCGATIRKKASPAEAVTATPPVVAPLRSNAASAVPAPPNGSRPRAFLVLGMLGGLLLICMLPVAGLGLAWFFSSEGKQSEKNDPPAIPFVQPAKLEPKQPPPMPPKIREAIDRGAVHLKKRILEKVAPYVQDRRYGIEADVGAIALAGLALLEARVPPQDPAILRVLAVVREEGPKIGMIYTLGSMLFFLNRLHEAEPLNASDRELVRSLALRLAAGQQPDGRWSYQNPPITATSEIELLQKLHANKYKPQTTLAQAPSNSMTQFAMLALWGSRRHDLPVRPILLTAAASFHQTQYPDGTWDYGPALPGKILFDSNTCAGLIALAMEKTLREDKAFQGPNAGDPLADPKTDERCAKAFTHLAKAIGRTKEDPTTSDNELIKLIGKDFRGKVIRADAWGDYYFLWCLERVAVIYDLKTIGGKDWYGWGSEVILHNQKEDGSWVDRHRDVPDTCFAILFLTRANLAKDLTESIRTRGGKAAIP